MPDGRNRMLLQFVVPVAMILGVVLLLMVAGSASFRALTKSRDHFVSHPRDARVLYEPGAEDYARRVAVFLATAVETVESAHGLPFKDPVRVYVCATQRSLNEYIAQPASAPIRGTVALESVFLAPSAFVWQGADTHRARLTHELSHLHFRQRMGLVTHRKSLPTWFSEALANLVSGTGGEEVTEQAALRAVRSGQVFEPDSIGSAFRPKGAQSYGLPAPMLHKQATMFLEFIRDSDPLAFDRFLFDLQILNTFAEPFRTHFGTGVEGMWDRFVLSLG